MPKEPGPPERQPPERANVLLVDDTPANLLALEAALEDLGHNLVKAASGEEALRLLLDRDFAAVLLDVRMPGLDGFETAKLIRGRERSRHTPIIFLTAHDDGPTVEQAYALGAVDYLVKPLAPVMLRAKVAGFVGLFEEKEQARLQAEQLRLLVQGTADYAIYLLDPQGRVATWNAGAERIKGYQAEEVIGRHFSRFYPPEAVGRGWPAEELKRAAAAGRFEDEGWRVRKDGSRFWANVVLTALKDEAGRLRGFSTITRDLTERRQREEELRQLHRDLERRVEERTAALAASNQALQGEITERGRAEARLRLLWEAAAVLLSSDDPDAMLRGLFEKVKGHLGVDAYFNFMVNEAGDALRLASCAGISDETARAISRLEFGQAVCGRVAQERRPIVATHIQQSRDEKVQLVKGLGIRAYACNPLLAQGRLLGTLSFASRSKDRFDAEEVGFLETVTHYVTVAYERLRLIRQLQEASRHKDEFLAMLAHELRNPLAPVLNGLHVLRLSEGDRQAVEQARGMMERQVQHLSRIVDDLLEVSRFTRGKLTLRPERLDLARLVRVTAEDHRHVFERAGLGLDLGVPELPVWVHGDPTRLAQVLSNLLQNAAKFTGRGGRVAVRVGTDEARRQAVLAVRDTGAGIDPDLLPRLFAPFAQADRSLERVKGGLGLGLALVKGLVDLHGGEAHAASEGPGRGAEFTVRLPRQPEPPALTAMPSTPGRTAKRLRILVVEDNQDAADSLRLLLELFGYDVAVAYSGPAGVKAAEDWQPDVVLCDIGLPGMNGYEVAGALRRNPATANARMIAVTGYGSDEDRRRSEAAGFDAHLTKPADPAAIQELLARSA
jgi:PAS domain S-box-containing protein